MAMPLLMAVKDMEQILHMHQAKVTTLAVVVERAILHRQQIRMQLLGISPTQVAKVVGSLDPTKNPRVEAEKDLLPEAFLSDLVHHPGKHQPRLN